MSDNDNKEYINKIKIGNFSSTHSKNNSVIPDFYNINSISVIFYYTKKSGYNFPHWLNAIKRIKSLEKIDINNSYHLISHTIINKRVSEILKEITNLIYEQIINKIKEFRYIYIVFAPTKNNNKDSMFLLFCNYIWNKILEKDNNKNELNKKVGLIEIDAKEYFTRKNVENKKFDDEYNNYKKVSKTWTTNCFFYYSNESKWKNCNWIEQNFINCFYIYIDDIFTSGFTLFTIIDFLLTKKFTTWDKIIDVDPSTNNYVDNFVSLTLSKTYSDSARNYYKIFNSNLSDEIQNEEQKEEIN